MSSRLPILHTPLHISGYGVAVAVMFTALVFVKFSQPSKLNAIPTVGSNGRFSSWWAGVRFLTNGLELIQEGYEKHKLAPFKINGFYRWMVIVSSRDHIDEVRKAPDDTLSFMEVVNDDFHLEYTVGPQIHHNPYHIQIVRSQLTRNIRALYPDIKDEIAQSFDAVLDLKSNEWKSVPVLSSMERVVCRTNNRVFVGLPLCRNPDWIDLNIRYTFDVLKSGLIIGLFPRSLRPTVARFLKYINRSDERGRKLLGPMIQERQRLLKECGKEWAEKPNDFLSWLMDEAQGRESTIELLTMRILVLNLVAIHTSSQTFTNALFYLAANPEYVQPLREEVETITKRDGWSKTSLGKMRKVDSFLKECQRVDGITGLTLARKTLKDFTFSDGTFIPKGTMIAAAARSIHYEEIFYKNAYSFEPFRFSDLRDEDGEGVKHQFSSTNTAYLPFGHGRHACPGRFFAATVLKSMLAHIVMTYDIKLPDDKAHPKILHVGTQLMPDASAKVMFRRRVK